MNIQRIAEAIIEENPPLRQYYAYQLINTAAQYAMLQKKREDKPSMLQQKVPSRIKGVVVYIQAQIWAQFTAFLDKAKIEYSSRDLGADNADGVVCVSIPDVYAKSLPDSIGFFRDQAKEQALNCLNNGEVYHIQNEEPQIPPQDSTLIFNEGTLREHPEFRDCHTAEYFNAIAEKNLLQTAEVIKRSTTPAEFKTALDNFAHAHTTPLNSSTPTYQDPSQKKDQLQNILDPIFSGKMDSWSIEDLAGVFEGEIHQVSSGGNPRTDCVRCRLENGISIEMFSVIEEDGTRYSAHADISVSQAN